METFNRLKMERFFESPKLHVRNIETENLTLSLCKTFVWLQWILRFLQIT